MEKTSEWLFSFNSQSSKKLNLNSITQNRLGKVISITGGKGGVGKTTFSLKFAKELVEKGHKVLLIDCDYNLSNTAIKLGLPVESNFSDLVALKKTFHECLYKQNNFHLLSGCNGSIELFKNELPFHEIIIDVISTHKDEYDYVLLDCPAGIAKDSLLLNAYSDERFVIVTPDKSSLTDSYSLIKILSQSYGVNSNHLVVNMYNSESQFQRIVQTLSETVENFLGGRTFILGGIKKMDVPLDMFDRLLFKEDNSAAHKNFLQLLNNYTEKFGEYSNGRKENGYLGGHQPDFQ